MKSLLTAVLLVIFLGLLVVAATAGFPGDEACLMDPCSRDPERPNLPYKQAED